MSGDRFRDIYRGQAARYQALIEAEDADGNLLPALEQIVAFKEQRILDVGSGTGRLSMLLRGSGAEIVALDLYRNMLDEQKRQRLETKDWRLVQGDARWLPFGGGWADVVTAGWAIGHFVGWFGEDWEREATRALGDMARAAKPGGMLIVLETLGTGVVKAGPPTPGLADYYAWLEGQGFARRVVQTDYEFSSVGRAAELCGFFFGAEMAERVRDNGWSRVPEWTGVWAKRT